MDESLAALAVIELPGRSVAADAGQRGHVKHAPQPAVVAFRPVQIATDAAGISWYRDQSGVGRQPARGGEGGQVAAGNDHEFRAEAGSEAGQRLDDVRVGVITEAFGDGFVDVFDLVVEVEQLAGQPFNQGGGARLPRQSQRLLLGRRHRGGGGFSDRRGPAPVVAQIGRDTLDTGRPDLGRCAQVCDQDQRACGSSSQTRPPGRERSSRAATAGG